MLFLLGFLERVLITVYQNLIRAFSDVEKPVCLFFCFGGFKALRQRRLGLITIMLEKCVSRTGEALTTWHL